MKKLQMILVGLIGVILVGTSTVYGQSPECQPKAMTGLWENIDTNAREQSRIEISFPCSHSLPEVNCSKLLTIYSDEAQTRLDEGEFLIAKALWSEQHNDIAYIVVHHTDEGKSKTSHVYLLHNEPEVVSDDMLMVVTSSPDANGRQINYFIRSQ